MALASILAAQRTAARKGANEAVEALIPQLGMTEGEDLPSLEGVHPAKREAVELQRMTAVLRRAAGLEPIEYETQAVSLSIADAEQWTRTGDADEDARREKAAGVRRRNAERMSGESPGDIETIPDREAPPPEFDEEAESAGFIAVDDDQRTAPSAQTEMVGEEAGEGTFEAVEYSGEGTGEPIAGLNPANDRAAAAGTPKPKTGARSYRNGKATK